MKRLRISLLIGFILCFTVLAWADYAGLTPQTTGSITTITSAKGITAADLIYTETNGRTHKAQAAFLTVETASINYTINGTTPTTAVSTNVGHELDPGSWIYLDNPVSVANFSCINRVASSGSVVKYTVFF